MHSSSVLPAAAAAQDSRQRLQYVCAAALETDMSYSIGFYTEKCHSFSPSSKNWEEILASFTRQPASFMLQKKKAILLVSRVPFCQPDHYFASCCGVLESRIAYKVNWVKNMFFRDAFEFQSCEERFCRLKKSWSWRGFHPYGSDRIWQKLWHRIRDRHRQNFSQFILSSQIRTEAL